MMKRSLGTSVEQADAYPGTKCNKIARKRKARYERRKAKLKPDAPPGYGKCRGYLS